MPQGRTYLLKLLLIAAIFTSGQATAVERALHVHWEDAELESLARAIGQELAQAPLTGSLEGAISGSIGGNGFVGRNLSFSIKVVETDAKFNGSTGILSNIQLSDLVVSFKEIQFSGYPGKICRNVSISSGANLLALKLSLDPAVEGGKLRLNASNIDFAPESAAFAAKGLGSCGASNQNVVLAKKLGQWAANTLKEKIVEGLADNATETIALRLGEINQGLSSVFQLPILQADAPLLSASVKLVPEAVLVGPNSLDISLGAEFSFGTDTQSPVSNRVDSMLNKETRSSSWIGITDHFLNGAVSAANAHGLFSPTLNEDTVPSMADLLHANALQALAPDARRRFEGSEPIEIRFGKAPKISVIYDPNGPGGIPIIDMLLDNIDIDVKVGGKPYLSTKNNMQFRFKAEMDKASNKLSLKFVGATSNVTGYKFDRNLNPRPRDRSFDRAKFTEYLKSFIQKSCKDPSKNSGFVLPSIEIGNYYFTWQRVRMLDQMLVLETSIESD